MLKRCKTLMIRMSFHAMCLSHLSEYLKKYINSKETCSTLSIIWDFDWLINNGKLLNISKQGKITSSAVTPQRQHCCPMV